MPKLIELTGLKFGRWTVLEFAGQDSMRKTYWMCRCDCGAVRKVGSRHLRGGNSRSCGCLTVDTGRQRIKHGHHRTGRQTPEYNTWCNMKRRCHDPKNHRYADWGGRGIVVCDKWKNDFAAFLADMGPKPPNGSLDRIDNDGPYAPENCRWTNAFEQRRNRRVDAIAHKGKSMTVGEWARELGMWPSTIHRRLDAGWSVHRALTTPRKM